MNRLLLLAVLAPTTIGCWANSKLTAQNNPPAIDSGEIANTYNEQSIGDWHDQIGQRVTLTGRAVNLKIGALLAGDGYGIYIDLPGNHWPSGLYQGGDHGERVRVTGTIAQRADLPVFISDPSTPIISGIPVPDGTDLEKTANRYILESVEWERAGDCTEQTDKPKPTDCRGEAERSSGRHGA